MSDTDTVSVAFIQLKTRPDGSKKLSVTSVLTYPKMEFLFRFRTADLSGYNQLWTGWLWAMPVHLGDKKPALMESQYWDSPWTGDDWRLMHMFSESNMATAAKERELTWEKIAARVNTQVWRQCFSIFRLLLRNYRLKLVGSYWA